MSDHQPPRTGMPTWAKVLLWTLAACVVCCIGVVALSWTGIRKIAEVASLPPGEQQAAVSEMLEQMATDMAGPARGFLDDLDAGRTSDAFARTSPEFRAAMDEAGLARLQRKIEGVLGPRSVAHLTNVNSRNNLGTGAATETCELVYAATHANGGATVKITLVKQGATWLVQGYGVESPLLFDAVPDPADDAGGDDAPK